MIVRNKRAEMVVVQAQGRRAAKTRSTGVVTAFADRPSVPLHLLSRLELLCFRLPSDFASSFDLPNSYSVRDGPSLQRESDYLCSHKDYEQESREGLVVDLGFRRV